MLADGVVLFARCDLFSGGGVVDDAVMACFACVVSVIWPEEGVAAAWDHFRCG